MATFFTKLVSQSAYHDRGKISLYIRKKELQIRSSELLRVIPAFHHDMKRSAAVAQALTRSAMASAHFSIFNRR